MKTITLKNATGKISDHNPAEWSNCYAFNSAYSDAYSKLVDELEERHSQLTDKDFNQIFNSEAQKLVTVKKHITDSGDGWFRGVVIEYDDTRIDYNPKDEENYTQSKIA